MVEPIKRGLRMAAGQSPWARAWAAA